MQTFGQMYKTMYIWDIKQTEKQKAMITNRRTLAIELSKGNVNASTVSKKLDRIVNLWLSRNEIVKEAGQYKLA